jgi:hypothetical protein
MKKIGTDEKGFIVMSTKEYNHMMKMTRESLMDIEQKMDYASDVYLSVLKRETSAEEFTSIITMDIPAIRGIVKWLLQEYYKG